MILNQNKNLINKLKILKTVKTDNNFKTSLKENLLNKMGYVTNNNINRLHKQQNQSTVLQKLINIYQLNYKTMIPLILILTLLGGGAGATFASQSALPGDALYPVKIASEKVETALTFSDSKDAKLHLDFATRRLNEINKLAEKGKVNTTVVDNAVKDYNQELVDVQNILNKTEKENSTQIATNLDSKITENKGILRAISKQIDDKNSLAVLSNVWNKSIEYQKIASTILGKDTTPIDTTDTTIESPKPTDTVDNTTTDQKTQPEVINKIQPTENNPIKNLGEDKKNEVNKNTIKVPGERESEDNPFGNSEDNGGEIDD